MLISYLLVFILAAVPLFELVTVIPLAIIGGLSPILTAVVAFLGNALTVVLLIIFMDRVKKWMIRRKQKRKLDVVQENDINEDDPVEVEKSKKGKRARLLFDKYGLPGLAIIGPFFVGSHIAAFMGMSFGSKKKAVTSWMMISLVFWTVISAVASNYGVDYFMPHVEEDGFLVRLFAAK